jgi:hypothetical protein
MRRISFGPEPQFATIVLLVCGPVFFGLALIAFESVRGVPAALVGIATHPADYSGYLLMIALWIQLFILSSSEGSDGEDEGDARPQRYPTDVYWAMGIGMLIAVGIARKDLGVPAGFNLNLAAYAAMVVAGLHLMFVWWQFRQRRAQGYNSPAV